MTAQMVKDEEQSSGDRGSVTAQFIRFKSVDYIPPQVMDRYFDRLEPVTLDELWGDWRGDYFFTGNRWARLLETPGLHWMGKKFSDPDNVEALMYRIRHIIFAAPIGHAYVRMKEFRGKTSAAMTYRYLPVTDNFRRINDKALMGVMDARIPGMDWLYFYIYRE